MYIPILAHELDSDFTSRLTVMLLRQGWNVKSVELRNIDTENFANNQTWIVVLRPNFISSSALMTVLQELDLRGSQLISVVRAPIELTQWPSGISFVDTIDFTDHDSESFNSKTLDLANLIKSYEPGAFSSSPSYLTMHISNLLLEFRPFDMLEYLNYGFERQLAPVEQYMENMLFETRGNSHSRKSPLGTIASAYPRALLVGRNYGEFFAKFLCRRATIMFSNDPMNNPLPYIVDLSTWDKNPDVITQFLNLCIGIANSPSEETRLLILHSATQHRIEALFEALESSVDLNSQALRIMVISNTDLKLTRFSPNFVTLDSVQTDSENIRNLCSCYLSRPLARYITSITNPDDFHAYRYFLHSPLFFSRLLSLKFGSTDKLHKLNIKQYFELLVDKLWENGRQINHDTETTFESVVIALAKISAIITNQGQMSIKLQDATVIVGSKFSLQTCIDGELLNQNGDRIEFTFPFLQEYFAAIALTRFGLPSGLPKLRLNDLNKRMPNNWDEALILMTHIHDANEGLLSNLADLDPLLALDCLNTCISTSARVFSIIIEKNLELMRILGDFRIEFARKLASLDVHSATSILIETMRDSSWDTRVAAFNTLHELKLAPSPGVVSVVDDFVEVDHIISAIQRIGTSATITLLMLLKSDNHRTRRKAAFILGQINDKAACPALFAHFNDANQNVALEAINSLFLLDDLQIIVPLARATKRSSPRIARAIRHGFLSMMLKNASEFINITQQIDLETRHIIVSSICDRNTYDMIEFALVFSFDPDPDIRIAAIQAFRNSADLRAIHRLEQCLLDMEKSKMRKYRVSEIAAKLLASSKSKNNEPKTSLDTDEDKRKSSEIVKARLLNAKSNTRNTNQSKVNTSLNEKITSDNLTDNPSSESNEENGDSRVAAILDQMRDQGWDISNDAAKELRDYAKQLRGKASTKVMNQIIEALNDNDWVIRWAGVETLGWIGNVHVIPHLIQRLNDENWKIRVASIRALVEIKDNSASWAISELVRDTNSIVREAAAEALGNLTGDKVIPALEKASTDSEEFVRLAAVESLGKIKDKVTVTSLISSLKDKSDHVRWAAANALVDISDPTIARELIPVLNDSGGPYWEQKRICDVIADILERINTDETNSALSLWRANQAQSLQ